MRLSRQLGNPMSTDMPTFHNTHDLAQRFGVSRHCVQVVVDRLKLGARSGRNRILMDSDLDDLERGLTAAGFVRATASENCRHYDEARPSTILTSPGRSEIET
jgi:hypothetical protein